jgi:hypothetical protein
MICRPSKNLEAVLRRYARHNRYQAAGKRRVGRWGLKK